MKTPSNTHTIEKPGASVTEYVCVREDCLAYQWSSLVRPLWFTSLCMQPLVMLNPVSKRPLGQCRPQRVHACMCFAKWDSTSGCLHNEVNGHDITCGTKRHSTHEKMMICRCNLSMFLKNTRANYLCDGISLLPKKKSTLHQQLQKQFNNFKSARWGYLAYTDTAEYLQAVCLKCVKISAGPWFGNRLRYLHVHPSKTGKQCT